MEMITLDERSAVESVLQVLRSEKKAQQTILAAETESSAYDPEDYYDQIEICVEGETPLPQHDWSISAFDRNDLQRNPARLVCADIDDALKLCTKVDADTPVFFQIGSGLRCGGTAGMYHAPAAESTIPATTSELCTLVGRTLPVEEDIILDSDGCAGIKDHETNTVVSPEIPPAAHLNRLEDILELKHAKKDRFFEAVEYENFFNQHQELGLSVTHYKTKSGKIDFRYRKKNKDGVAGGFVSKAYVQEAVEALGKYHSLIREGRILDLFLAKNLAADYFTEEAATESLYAIKDIIKEKAETLLDEKFIYPDCRQTLKIGEDWDGLRKEGIIAINKYERLMKEESWENLFGAKTLAEHHFKRDAVEQLEGKLYTKAVSLAEKLRDEGELLAPETVPQVVNCLLYNDHSEQLINDDPTDLTLAMEVMKTYPGIYTPADLKEVEQYHQAALGIPAGYRKPATAEIRTFPAASTLARDIEEIIESADAPEAARKITDEVPRYSLSFSFAY